MSKHYWIVTRPKRKLIIIPELLKVFSATSVGKKWGGNRLLQIEFEKQLVIFQWKAQNISVDGSGSRTYAVLLFMLGLWYEDSEGVKLTKAGEELIRDEPSVPILTKQLLNFQYPSSYSKKPNVNVDRRIKLQPHSFVIELLLGGSLDEITQEELAICVIPFAETHRDLATCIARIQDFRMSKAEITADALALAGTSRTNLINIANTVINQLEYTGFFIERDDNLGIIKFNDEGKRQAELALSKYRRAIAVGTEDDTTFQKRYGSGLITSKDYTHSNPIPPTINPTERLVLLAFYEISLKKPLTGITGELIATIARTKGVPVSTVRRVLGAIAQQPLMDRFEDMYLKIAKGGRDTATEFEIKTSGILSEDGFGFESEWVGPSPRHPDIFVYFDHKNKLHGILDTKAYREYNLPLDHKTKMATIYVPLYRKINYKGEEYSLGFFGYVAGGYGSNIKNSFDELLAMTGVPGSYITAYNFMHLLRMHREKAFTPSEFGSIFASKKEIKYDEIRIMR